MARSFDPYLNWLGIRDSERPPNHYRLLGVEPFESNPDVIANAADRQMAYVRTFQSGKHADLSQRILNELAAAKLFLLKPEKKAAYDARLRARPASAPPVKPAARSAPSKRTQRPGPAAAAAIAPVHPGAAASAVRSPVASPLSHARRDRRAKRTFLITALAGIALAVLLGVVGLPGLLAYLSDGDPNQVSSATDGDDPDPALAEGTDTATADDGENGEDATPSADDLVVDDVPLADEPEERPVPDRGDAPTDAPGPSPPVVVADILPDAKLPAPVRRPLAEPLTPAVDTTLATARSAMATRSLDMAEDRLARADGQAVTQADRDAVARTQSVLSYLKQCWSAAHRELGRLSPGDQITIGTTPVSVVKVTSHELVVGADGKQRSFALAGDHIETSLVAALARRGLARSGPHAQAALAALWASDRDADPSRALAYCRFAGDRGVPVEMLQEELELDYALPVQAGDSDAEPPEASADLPFEPTIVDTSVDASVDAESQPRVAVPDAAAVRDATTKVRGIFADEYRKATTSQARVALARTLRGHAGKTADDDVDRYALFLEARSIAQQLGDSALALEITGEMARLYDLNAFDEKASVLEAMVRTVRSADDIQALLDQTIELCDRAAKDEKFPRAEELADTAIAVARKSKDREVLKRAVARKNRIKEQAKDLEQAKRAYLSLRTDPDDGKANLAAGRYLCLTRGDWKRGLPLLAKGDDQELAAAARADLSAQRSAKGEAAAGDVWWDLAQSARGSDKPGLQARAVFWYQKALEKSPSGLAAVQIKKRLEEIDQARFQGESGDNAGGPIFDLLAMVDPGQHTEYPPNSWVRRGTSISTGRGASHRFRLPVAPQGDYELVVEYEQIPLVDPKGSSILVHLPNSRTSCYFVLATAAPKVFNGLSAVAAKGQLNDSFSVTREPTPGRHTVSFRVLSRGEDVAILAKLDGRALVQWQGAQQRLSVPAGLQLSNPRAFGIASGKGDLIIHQAKLRMLSGQAVRVP